MKKLLFVLAFGACSLSAFSQVAYSKRIEFSFQKYRTHVVNYEDGGTGFKGYHLTGNGFDLNMVNGFFFGEHLFMGAGVGYGNYSGDHALQAFFDLQAIFMKTRFSPLLNLKIGYNHLFNQYDGGTRGFIMEGGLGISYRLSEAYIITMQSGGMILQDAAMLPIRIGFLF